LVEDSSYTWWLKGQVEANSDEEGNRRPDNDFCYLDGAHNWTIDGVSAVLVERLLRPGGWLLLDDLGWTHAGIRAWPGQGPDDLHLSRAEQRAPHMRAIFDLIVRQHSSFTQLRLENEWCGGHARRLASRVATRRPRPRRVRWKDQRFVDRLGTRG
jgi:hypothetical protein